MNKKVIIIVALIVIVGGYFLVNGMNKNTLSEQTNVPNDNQANTNQEVVPVVNVEVESNAGKTTTSYEVVYTDAGYYPSALTVKAGDMVTFKNQSSGGMWVGSVMHPTHVVYSGTTLQQHCPDTTNTSFDECKNAQSGESWSFTFAKAGSWGYHNHSNSRHFGKITVE